MTISERASWRKSSSPINWGMTSMSREGPYVDWRLSRKRPSLASIRTRTSNICAEELNWYNHQIVMRAATLEFLFFQNSKVGDYCKFWDKGHPYLKLQPLKVEVLLDDPLIHVYHDIVNDEDIAKMKRMASSKLYTSVLESHMDKFTQTNMERTQVGNSTDLDQLLCHCFGTILRIELCTHFIREVSSIWWTLYQFPKGSGYSCWVETVTDFQTRKSYWIATQSTCWLSDLEQGFLTKIATRLDLVTGLNVAKTDPASILDPYSTFESEMFQVHSGTIDLIN